MTRLDMWLGGEPAAAVLTKHLRPEITTLYGGEQFAILARKIQPVKDEHGNLEGKGSNLAFCLNEPNGHTG